MAEYKVMAVKQIANPKAGDKIYSYEGYGVKKIGLRAVGSTCTVSDIQVYSTPQVIEFPQLGKSLPCLFDISYVAEESGVYLNIIVMEYGGQPDPRYFDIIGLDEVGMPIYEDEGE